MPPPPPLARCARSGGPPPPRRCAPAGEDKRVLSLGRVVILPHDLAERIDGDEARGRIEVPERPAVARVDALRERAHAMNGADCTREADSSVGAHKCLHLALA